MSDPGTPAAPVSPAVPATSTVWRQRRYGGPDAVVAETVRVAAPRRGRVLVRMEAVSLNSGDIHLLRGEPKLLRPFAGWRGPRVRGRGMDVAGTVIAVGDRVDALVAGDRVVGAWRETLADVVEVPVARLSRIPAVVDPVVAAALPIAGNTAVTVLDACRVRSGSRVLVVGAGGGVGTLTVQLAADRGAEVWATCGSRAEELLRGLGAARTFDHRAVPLAEVAAEPDATGGFDAIVDIAGEPPLEVLSGLLAPGGTVALVGGEGAGVLGPIPRMLRALAARGRYRSIAAVTKPAVTAALVDLAASGRLTPPIERTYRLAETPAALAHVDAGHTVGKVVVIP